MVYNNTYPKPHINIPYKYNDSSYGINMDEKNLPLYDEPKSYTFNGGLLNNEKLSFNIPRPKRKYVRKTHHPHIINKYLSKNDILDKLNQLLFKTLIK
jgi:hypothetical protein